VIVWTHKELSAKERRLLLASAQALVLKSDGVTALMDEVRALVPLAEAMHAVEVSHGG
jgi:hypothetical protein